MLFLGILGTLKGHGVYSWRPNETLEDTASRRMRLPSSLKPTRLVCTFGYSSVWLLPPVPLRLFIFAYAWLYFPISWEHVNSSCVFHLNPKSTAQYVAFGNPSATTSLIQLKLNFSFDGEKKGSEHFDAIVPGLWFTLIRASQPLPRLQTVFKMLLKII